MQFEALISVSEVYWWYKCSELQWLNHCFAFSNVKREHGLNSACCLKNIHLICCKMILWPDWVCLLFVFYPFISAQQIDSEQPCVETVQMSCLIWPLFYMFWGFSCPSSNKLQHHNLDLIVVSVESYILQTHQVFVAVLCPLCEHCLCSLHVPAPD